jgi:hypothetical protein
MKTFWSLFVERPAYISALAALASAIAALISVTLYYKTLKLLKRKARPWLLLEDINNGFWGLQIKIKNTGEHPARLIQVKYRYAPMKKLEEYIEAKNKRFSINIPLTGGLSIEKDSSFSDKLAVGGYLLTSYEQLGPEDYIVFFQLDYEDVFTDKTFVEQIWQKYRYIQGLQGVFEALSKDELKKTLPYIKKARKK